ncbi:peroxisome biogenesis protein 19-1-like [Planoprotostelium fungivorum]|uniref:Peroxisome biogenesis protein 19-1-like n=1 Tax=Planoprotostelium fungivorum TaxID=1890364 RepID=A0A2P6NRG0_9EUKA|nr:peroxisome biogenesis protein 19-1-like [Planoprotostelium fungivorum]
MADDLDDILDSALDEIENVEKRENTASTPKAERKAEGNSEDGKSENTEDNMEADIHKLLEGLNTGTLDDKLSEMLGGMDGLSGLGDLGNMSEEDMLNMMQSMGDKPEMQQLMNEMMTQLMSKDIIYEPVKELQKKYPQWLEENKDKVSAEQLTHFTNQLNAINTICEEFEKSDGQQDSSKIAEVMTQLQEPYPPGILGESGETGALAEQLAQMGIGGEGSNENCNVM